MSGHSNVVAWCKMQVGETETPPGSNSGAFVQFCQSHTWLKGTGWPWCAAFVVTAISEGAGVGYPCPTASAFGLLADAKIGRAHRLNSSHSSRSRMPSSA